MRERRDIQPQGVPDQRGLPPSRGAAHRFLLVVTLRHGSCPLGYPRIRRAAVLAPRCRWPGPAQSWWPCSLRPPSCRQTKITVKGAFGVAHEMAQAPPLSSDLPRQDPAPLRWNFLAVAARRVSERIGGLT